MSVLGISGLHTGYGDVPILHGLDLAIDEGMIGAVVGANGAGKTTMMRAVAGILPAWRGEIRLDGMRLDGLPSGKRVEAGVILVPEGRKLFPSMSVRENLELGSLHPRAKAARARTLEQVFEIFPRLREREGQRAGTLSGGEQQMCAIGRGLMGLPRVLMLDEPSLGLAPIVVETIFDVVRRIRAEGVTVLMVEQNVRHALALSDRAWVLEHGRIEIEGAGREMLSDERVRRAYLGM
ncbi:ABC transporter ATP-binding protein [Limibaculum sp. FT325]|uniref:ABC transporter ATP-binding protein n=1 Tax=Thermohalobaculum sediminis TaxID=2939436 RepID=UPI0020BF56A8|nr:ABC transporter ATP-binding protein [Limibaculum sediminis]MCL5776507.1 ABC transporter ATP-binding protein [Limibaculum sediminis]